MASGFLLYGSTGFVGDYVARLAVQRGLNPTIAGRNAAKVEAQAAELGANHCVFGLEDSTAMDKALRNTAVVLHCAGPYIYTYKPMVEGCLRTGAHYLDLTGEIPVLEALAGYDAEAKSRKVMVLPAVGYDVVPSDCLALHLKQRLPTATQLALAFHSRGPAGLPPGTATTMMEMIPYGAKVRHNGELVPFPREVKSRMIDFGRGPVEAILFPWADVFTAFCSTQIPNIEDYAVISAESRRQASSLSKLSPLFRLAAVRHFFRRRMKAGSTAEERAATSTSLWGEVQDDQGRRAVSRLHGPEGGVIWTALSALAAVRQVLAGNVRLGFQTPALAYGPDFVLECEGVTREDLN
jgi:short subunit dehydrogenase-like uncharacterized protein